MSPNILIYSKESNLTLSTVNLDLVLKETSFFYAMTTPIIAFFLSVIFKNIKNPARSAGFYCALNINI